MINKNFSEIDKICLSNLMLIDFNKFEKICRKISKDAIYIIACNNLFFMANNLKVADIKDLHHIARVFDPANGPRVVNELFSRHIYQHTGNYYYSELQLQIIGHPLSQLDYDIACYKNLCIERGLYFPTMDVMSRKCIDLIFGNLFKKLNAELPHHIAERLKVMPETLYSINVEECFRMLNCYISLNPSYIGLKKYIDILLKVMRVNARDLMKLIKRSDIWKCDTERDIIYDPLMRLKKGMQRDPGTNEVACAKYKSDSAIFYVLFNL